MGVSFLHTSTANTNSVLRLSIEHIETRDIPITEQFTVLHIRRYGSSLVSQHTAQDIASTNSQVSGGCGKSFSATCEKKQHMIRCSKHHDKFSLPNKECATCKKEREEAERKKKLAEAAAAKKKKKEDEKKAAKGG